MSLQEIRRFRADMVRKPELIEHIRNFDWNEVVDFAHSHGYQFDLEESFRYFKDIHTLALEEHGMTKTEIVVWLATDNPNALVEDKMPKD
jgi:endonuclease IV